jgi:group I intron endonuclease
MKPNKLDNKKCGVYCITNNINGKVYIGKSKNIYSRMYQHLSDLKLKRYRCENSHFLNAWWKYGNENFTYHVLEYLDLNEKLVKQRELYWMIKYNSTNRNYGYNLRMDSDTNMIVHEETSLKISKRLKKEWNDGVRRNHGKKLSDNWKSTPKRNLEQSQIMTKNLTKYSYNLYDLDNNFIKNIFYKELKELGLKGVITSIHQYKQRNIIKNKVKYKGFFVEKIKI